MRLNKKGYILYELLVVTCVLVLFILAVFPVINQGLLVLEKQKQEITQIDEAIIEIVESEWECDLCKIIRLFRYLN